MGFEVGRKRGSIWEDAKFLHKTILEFPFQTTGNEEKVFERGFATTLMATKNSYNSQVITQIDKENPVKSIYCFGKNHRPDMTLGEDGIAIEMKFITYSGLKSAIGQGHLYRLSYKFVFLVLIVSEKRKQLYEEIENGQEKPLEDVLNYLAEDMNIFSYIVPAFRIRKPAIRKVVSFFPESI